MELTRASGPAALPAAIELPETAPQPGTRTPAVVLTIAGFDPSSGAGLTADLKVFAAHRLHGVAAATALTVQSTEGVRRVVPVSAALLSETLDCLADDLPLSGIKIGMLGTEENVSAVAEFLEGLFAWPDNGIPIVLDPVLRSSSGHSLLDSDGLRSLRSRLLPLVTCTTPNVDELFLLAQARELTPPLTSPDAIAAAASVLTQHIPHLAVIATGGHLAQPDDYVLAPGQPGALLAGEWVDTRATHGTGCAYSSALLCGLVAGLPLLDAARAAKRYVTEALRAAQPIGRGGGSMHHLYAAFASYQKQASLPPDEQASPPPAASE